MSGTQKQLPSAEKDVAETRRGGRWVYGDHSGLNPGWRLVGTNLVLDYDRSNRQASVPGCWMLWRDGQEADPIDHYLDGAMAYVERYVLPPAEGDA